MKLFNAVTINVSDVDGKNGLNAELGLPPGKIGHGDTDGTVMDGSDGVTRLRIVANGRRVGTGRGGIVDTIIIKIGSNRKTVAIQLSTGSKTLKSPPFAAYKVDYICLFLFALFKKCRSRSSPKIPFYKLRPR